MFKRKNDCEISHPKGDLHPEFESVNTSVSEYFRKFSGGRSALMPTDNRPEVSDDRDTEDMLDDDSKINHLGCDDLDCIMEMQAHEADYRKALEEIELTKKQREQFIQATDVLDNPNSTNDQKREAYELLEELKDKVTRARKS